MSSDRSSHHTSEEFASEAFTLTPGPRKAGTNSFRNHRALEFIKPDRYEEVESGCRYTEVKTWFDPTIPVATKTKLGAYVSRVTAQCTGEGDKWREEATFYFSKGMLYFSRKQTR